MKTRGENRLYTGVGVDVDEGVDRTSREGRDPKKRGGKRGGDFGQARRRVRREKEFWLRRGRQSDLRKSGSRVGGHQTQRTISKWSKRDLHYGGQRTYLVVPKLRRGGKD